MTQIYNSKYAYGPRGVPRFARGDVAIYGKNNTVITIVSDLMKHQDAPGDGLGYEAIFHDTNERAFAAERDIKNV